MLRAFEATVDRAPILSHLVDAMESALLRHTAHRHDSEEEFATLVVGQLAPDGATLHLLNRGHPAPLLLRPGQVRRLEPARRHLPLGLSDLHSGSPLGTDTIAFPEDATLLLLTDGVTEARDTRGSFYDPVARLARYGCAVPEDLLDLLRRDVGRHAGGRVTDDMALLAIRHVRAGCSGRRYGRRGRRLANSR